jgi:hypothetical protein
MMEQPLFLGHAIMAELEDQSGCEASMSPAVVSPVNKPGTRDIGIPGGIPGDILGGSPERVGIKRGFGQDRRASRQQRPHPIERTQTWI